MVSHKASLLDYVPQEIWRQLVEYFYQLLSVEKVVVVVAEVLVELF